MTGSPTAPAAKLKSERIQGMREALPDWRPVGEGDALATAYAFSDAHRGQDFCDLARELIATEGLPVELGPCEGCLVRVTVRATDVRGLGERELAAAAALDRLYYGCS